MIEDIDRRSLLFVGLTPENLAGVTGTYPRSAFTPREVADLLAEARRLFVGAAHSYDNFAAASFKALQAAEHALRWRLGERAAEKATLGQLLQVEGVTEILGDRWSAWFREFALHFRNSFAHPTGSTALPPGMAEPFVRTAHEVVAFLFPE